MSDSELERDRKQSWWRPGSILGYGMTGGAALFVKDIVMKANSGEMPELLNKFMSRVDISSNTAMIATAVAGAGVTIACILSRVNKAKKHQKLRKADTIAYNEIVRNADDRREESARQNASDSFLYTRFRRDMWERYNATISVGGIFDFNTTKDDLLLGYTDNERRDIEEILARGGVRPELTRDEARRAVLQDKDIDDRAEAEHVIEREERRLEIEQKKREEDEDYRLGRALYKQEKAEKKERRKEKRAEKLWRPIGNFALCLVNPVHAVKEIDKLIQDKMSKKYVDAVRKYYEAHNDLVTAIAGQEQIVNGYNNGNPDPNNPPQIDTQAIEAQNNQLTDLFIAAKKEYDELSGRPDFKNQDALKDTFASLCDTDDGIEVRYKNLIDAKRRIEQGSGAGGPQFTPPWVSNPAMAQPPWQRNNAAQPPWVNGSQPPWQGAPGVAPGVAQPQQPVYQRPMAPQYYQQPPQPQIPLQRPVLQPVSAQYQRNYH